VSTGQVQDGCAAPQEYLCGSDGKKTSPTDRAVLEQLVFLNSPATALVRPILIPIPINAYCPYALNRASVCLPRRPKAVFGTETSGYVLAALNQTGVPLHVDAVAKRSQANPTDRFPWDFLGCAAGAAASYPEQRAVV
jgi:hypothetical protein